MEHKSMIKRMKRLSAPSDQRSRAKGLFSSQMNRKLPGFTLIELIISIFIFLLIMTATVTIFTREVTAYRIARETQKNLENAQFTLNFIAKTLRTSQVNAIEPDNNNANMIFAYDHSQRKCFVFSFEEDALMMRRELDEGEYSGDPIKPGECTNNSYFPSNKMDDVATPLTIGTVTGHFEGKITQGEDIDCQDVSCITLGAITTSLVIEPEGGAKNDKSAEKIYIQSTASLRDYPNADIPL